MSQYTVTIIYPKTETSTFDIDYYLKTHMPLVAGKWNKDAGLLDVKVTKLDPTIGYVYQAHLIWKSAEQLQASMAKHSAEIMGDIPNFTNVQPLVLTGEVLWEA